MEIVGNFLSLLKLMLMKAVARIVFAIKKLERSYIPSSVLSAVKVSDAN